MSEKPPTSNLTCRELVELITEYLEDGLTPEARADFEAHLESCGGCEMYLQQMRATVRALRHNNEQSIDAASREKLLQLFRDWKRLDKHDLFIRPV